MKNLESARIELKQKNYNTIINSALSEVSEISSEIIQMYSEAKKAETENKLKEKLKEQYTTTMINSDSNSTNNNNIQKHETAKYKYRAILTILFLEAYEKSKKSPNNQNINHQMKEYEEELKSLDSK